MLRLWTFVKHVMQTKLKIKVLSVRNCLSLRTPPTKTFSNNIMADKVIPGLLSVQSRGPTVDYYYSR